MYVVKPEKGKEVRVLHRNLLLPVGENLRELDEEPENTKCKANGTQKKMNMVVEELKNEEESSETSEDENEYERAVKPKRQRKNPERLKYDKLGSPGVDRSKDRILGCIVQLLEHQQSLVAMLSSMFGHFQKFHSSE